jgi:hypothetical protein
MIISYFGYLFRKKIYDSLVIPALALHPAAITTQLRLVGPGINTGRELLVVDESPS